MKIADQQLRHFAHVDSTLKKLEGEVRLVAVRYQREHNSDRYRGYINFEPTLRNITSCGPRSYQDPNQIIYANEEFDDHDNVEYNRGPKMDIAENNSTDECIQLTRRLYEVLPTTPFRYTFNLDGLKDEKMKQFLSTHIVGDYEKITFCGRSRGALNHDEMDFLMNMVKPDTYFELNCEVPDIFEKEKAFQFKSFFYHLAKWVTVDDIKSLRNHNIVRLGQTKLTNEDFNKLLKYWTECDELMMNTFSAHIGQTEFFSQEEIKCKEKTSLSDVLEDVQNYLNQFEETRCDLGIILTDLNYFSPLTTRAGIDVPVIHYIKSKIPGRCAELRVFKTRLELSTRMSTFWHGNVQEIMKITYEQDKLMKEKVDVVDEIDGYELIMDDYPNGSQEKLFLEEEMKKMDEKKKEIEKKMNDLADKMNGLGFVNNIQTYVT